MAACLATVLISACGTKEPPGAGTPDGGPPDGGGPLGVPRPCPDLYAQDILPTFEIEIDPAEWAALHDEYANWEERMRQGLPVKPYHPLQSFKYEDEVITNAMIRLKGNPCCSWDQDKLQLVIAFNQIDRKGRFRGLRKLDLDSPSYDPTYLRNRVALAWMRELGLPASCANNARLVVNGAYYGLYGNIERVDKEFLERNFDNPEGDLFKHGWELKTNEETSNTHRAELFWDTLDPATLETFVNVAGMVKAWAAEAVMPDADGYWAGSDNFYLYDHPTDGFQFITYDLDDAFDELRYDFDPYLMPEDGGERPHFDALMADARWRAYFFEQVVAATAAYDVAKLTQWTDEWSAQIEEAARTDPHRPFDYDEHRYHLGIMKDYYAQRSLFLADWIACQDGTAPRDADGDGFPWCMECDDTRTGTHPGATEVCNDIDDDCNGVVDDDAGDTCPDCRSIVVDGQTLLLCTRPRTFADSIARCQSQGAVISAPMSQAEQDAVFAEAQRLDENLALWLGISDETTEGDWRFLDGEPLPYENWEPDQPNGGDWANCAVLHPDHGGQWNDKSCTDERYAVLCRVP